MVKRCQLLLLFAVNLSTGTFLVAGTNDPDVAVLPFSVDGGSVKDPGLVAGISDMMWISLQENGAAIVEREQIRAILTERSLDASGLVRAGSLIRKKLPHVRYLVHGRLTSSRQGQYLLMVTAVDVPHARETSVRVVHSASSATVLDGIPGLAKQLATDLARVPSESSTADQTNEREGFTRKPEAAALFYKGAALVSQGRPGYGLFFLRDALRFDKDFRDARLWSLAAYRASGHTNAADEMAKAPDLQGYYKKRGKTEPGTQRRRTVSLETTNDYDSAVVSVKQNLIERGKVAVFNSGWVTHLTEEADLGISKEFEGLDVYRRAWLAVDIVVGVRPSATGHLLSIHQGITGDLLAATPLDGTPESIKAACTLIESAGSGSQPIDWGKYKIEPFVRLDLPPKEGAPVAPDRDIHRFAAAMEGSAQGDPSKRLHCLLVLREFYPVVFPPLVSDCIPLCEEFVSVVDRVGLPNGDIMLSTILSAIRWDKHVFRPPFLEDFAPLLARFPASKASKVIRFAAGHQFLEGQDFKKAAELLLPLCDDPPEIFGGMYQSYLYFAAVAAKQTGRADDAGKLLSRLQAILPRNDKPVSGYAGSKWVIGIDGAERMDYGEWRKDDLRPDIAQLVRELGVTTPLPVITERTSSEVRILLDKARPDQIPALVVQYLDRLADELGTAESEDIFTVVSKMGNPCPVRLQDCMRYLRSKVDLEQVTAAAVRVSEVILRHPVTSRYDGMREALSVLTMVGAFDAAHAILDRRLALLTKENPRSYMLRPLLEQKMFLLLQTHGLKAAVDFGSLHKDRLSRDVRMQLAAMYLDAGCVTEAAAFLKEAGAGDSVLKARLAYEQGDPLEAATILRRVGDPGAVALLMQLRLAGKAAFPQSGWRVPMLATPPKMPFLPPPTNDAERAVLDLRVEYDKRQNIRSPDERIAQIAKRYGRACLAPALRALDDNAFTWDQSIGVQLLADITTLLTANDVMPSFARHHELADVAFRLDPGAAGKVLEKHAERLCGEPFISSHITDAIVNNRLEHLYGVLFVYIAKAGDNDAVILKTLDPLVDGAKVPDIGAKYREALSLCIEERLRQKKGWYLVSICDLGLKRGVPGAIKGMLASIDVPDGKYGGGKLSTPECAAGLRPYIDLPAGDNAAMAELRRTTQWTWKSETRKFVAE